MKRLWCSLVVAASIHGALLVLGPAWVPRSAEAPLPAAPVMIDLGVKTVAASEPTSGTAHSFQTESEPFPRFADRSSEVPVRPAPTQGPPQESAAEPERIPHAIHHSVEKTSAPVSPVWDQPPFRSAAPATAAGSVQERKAPAIRKAPRVRQATARAPAGSEKTATGETPPVHPTAAATAAGSSGSQAAPVSGGRATSGALATGTASPAEPAIPIVLNNPVPAYPELARKRGQQGMVLLEVQVGPTGSVTQLRLHRSSGYQNLDRAALETVARWRFRPGKENEQPVSMWVRVPVRFVLE